jgi:hypothetical protein
MSETPTLEVSRSAEEPEHRSERRRFLVWALMLGAIPPERVTERVVAEVERELVDEPRRLAP